MEKTIPNIELAGRKCWPMIYRGDLYVRMPGMAVNKYEYDVKRQLFLLFVLLLYGGTLQMSEANLILL